jgi:hypothetical protein
MKKEVSILAVLVSTFFLQDRRITSMKNGIQIKSLHSDL